MNVSTKISSKRLHVKIQKLYLLQCVLIPEARDNVLTASCIFDTSDDCIAIKAGKNLHTQFGVSHNIEILNCIMQSGYDALTLGSEMADGIELRFPRSFLFSQSKKKQSKTRFDRFPNQGLQTYFMVKLCCAVSIA